MTWTIDALQERFEAELDRYLTQQHTLLEELEILSRLPFLAGEYWNEEKWELFKQLETRPKEQAVDLWVWGRWAKLENGWQWVRPLISKTSWKRYSKKLLGDRPF